MDPSQLKRDPKRVHQDLSVLRDKRMITKEGCKLYIPARFQEQKLASIGAESYVLGIFAIVVGDKYYGVSNVPSMMKVDPATINTVTIEEEDYLELVFEAGDTVVSNVDLVKNDALLYYIYNEVIAKGHVPWYINYEDLGRLFEQSKKYAGASLGANHAVMEMIAASVTRDASNKTKFYRHTVESKDDLEKRPPVMIPLRSVTYGATNTTAKLIGAYWDEGVTSALVNPSDKVEPIEEILRR